MHMTRHFAVHLSLPLAATLLASLGCGGPQPVGDVHAESASTGCADCHGDRTPGVLPGDPRGAPGFDGGTDVKGRTAGDPSATSIGAHARHLTAGVLGVKVACDECHAVPGTMLAPGHLDGPVTVTFGAVATSGGLSPSYDPVTKTCSNVYCHGGTPFLKADVQPVAPRWGQGRDLVVCGSCHDLPPPPPLHVAIDKARQGCNTSISAELTCHPAPYSPIAVDPRLHIDGRICPPSCDPVTR